MYSPLFWDHVRQPRNNRALPDALVGKGAFQRCGDRLTLYITVDNGIITQAAFQAKACAPVIAVASLGTEMIQGLDIQAACQLSMIDMDKELGGLPPSKRHAYLVFLESLHNAIHRNLNKGN